MNTRRVRASLRRGKVGCVLAGLRSLHARTERLRAASGGLWRRYVLKSDTFFFTALKSFKKLYAHQEIY